MLQIAICENEEQYADQLEKYLRIWALNAAVNVRIKKYTSGEMLLSGMKKDGMFDLIFMDIEMEGMSGLETAAKIRETDYLTALIFVSQYEDYYREAYHVHPFHFLGKPVNLEELEETMDAYMKMKNQDMETFSFTIRKAQYNLRLNDIIYFYSEYRQVTAVCNDQKYSFYSKLSEVQRELEGKSSYFLRIHQSYLVNTRYVKEYHYNNVVMHNGEILCVSRENRKRMSEIHMLLMEQ